MAVLVLVNNLAHDFCAAGWIFSAIYGWLLLKRTQKNDKLTAYVDVLGFNQWFLRLSFAGVMLFGISRLIFYKDYEWSEAAGESQVPLLVIKHIFFTVIVVLGILVYIKVGKFLKENKERGETNA